MNKNNIWNYSESDDGVIERTVYIKAKKCGDPIRIAHLTDMHFNFCNEKDIKENDPVLMSTYANREWLKNGSSVENAKRSLKHAKDADAIVTTGDILDYLSFGCEKLAKEYVFKPYPDLIAALGNHETARKVQGIYAETMPYTEKEKWLKTFWPNDIHYSSHIISERVMIIQMDNCSSGNGFRSEQIDKLNADIKKARKSSYIALLFFHIHISPENEKYSDVKADMIGDEAYSRVDLNRYGIKEKNGIASKEICEIIRSSEDVIKGCFCGHMHSDFYCEIEAENGKTIPQYILMGTPYGKGHILNIIIS